ncbi:hypothetical protein INR49_006012 [Caranx melampygus]|nr:hypothetical protein INR49_006012 [Caranx melampygus]
MVLIKEYRVVLPCSVEEYQVGQLFSVAEASKMRQVVVRVSSKVPGFVKLLAPEGSLNEYMKDNFFIKIETWHKPDLGMQENVHKLDNSTWQNVSVVPIDIADRSQDYKPDEDPAKFKSAKTGRGPLGPTWKKELVNKTDCPRMCAYKLVTVKFKWWGLQTKVENFIHEQEKRIFTNFHRQLFCWIDKWVELTMDDIRQMEAETQRELDELRKKAKLHRTARPTSPSPPQRPVSLIWLSEVPHLRLFFFCFILDQWMCL